MTQLQTLPKDLRRHVTVDVEGIAKEWAQGLHVVDSSGGWVWAFDTGSQEPAYG
jgi:hypothetical protein